MTKRQLLIQEIHQTRNNPQITKCKNILSAAFDLAKPSPYQVAYTLLACDLIGEDSTLNLNSRSSLMKFMNSLYRTFGDLMFDQYLDIAEIFCETVYLENKGGK